MTEQEKLIEINNKVEFLIKRKRELNDLVDNIENNLIELYIQKLKIKNGDEECGQ